MAKLPNGFTLAASPESLVQMEMCKEQAIKLGQSFIRLSTAFNDAKDELDKFGLLLKNIDIQMKVREG